MENIFEEYVKRQKGDEDMKLLAIKEEDRRRKKK